MKRREGKGAPTDLLVCFPTRAHLTLMPKAICSPARGLGPNKNSHHHPHHLRKSSIRRGGSIGGSGGSHGSPYMLSKTKQMGSDYSEPTSPKVTCAGQIRVRPRANPCKSWQSVMEEIEKLHNNKQKKKATWVEALGFKKEVMQFLTCLRSVKFDFRCFGSFPHANVTSDDDEDDEEEDEEDDHHHKQNTQELDDQEGSSKAVFSKWFMVLQDNQHPGIAKEKDTLERERDSSAIDDPPCGPPPNALLLMRCRSAPAKSWQEEKEEEDDDDEEEEEYENGDEKNDEREIEKRKIEEEIQRKDNSEMQVEEKEKEKKKKRESLEELMRYESDFYKFSSDIAKETWVIGGIKDILSRSKSSRR